MEENWSNRRRQSQLPFGLRESVHSLLNDDGGQVTTKAESRLGRWCDHVKAKEYESENVK